MVIIYHVQLIEYDGLELRDGAIINGRVYERVGLS
jgi:hypothetical protein